MGPDRCCCRESNPSRSTRSQSTYEWHIMAHVLRIHWATLLASTAQLEKLLLNNQTNFSDCTHITASAGFNDVTGQVAVKRTRSLRPVAAPLRNWEEDGKPCYKGQILGWLYSASNYKFCLILVPRKTILFRCVKIIVFSNTYLYRIPLQLSRHSD